MVLVLTDKKTSLHKHKVGACDNMLGYLMSTCCTSDSQSESVTEHIKSQFV